MRVMRVKFLPQGNNKIANLNNRASNLKPFSYQANPLAAMLHSHMYASDTTHSEMSLNV